MVSRDVMIRLALRYETAMSRAMLRALGREVPRVRPRGSRMGRGNAHAQADHRRYRAMRWCFRNYGSPMR